MNRIVKKIIEIDHCGEACPHWYRTPNKTYNFETDKYDFTPPRRYCLEVRKIIETTKGFPEFCPLKEGGSND